MNNDNTNNNYYIYIGLTCPTAATDPESDLASNNIPLFEGYAAQGWHNIGQDISIYNGSNPAYNGGTNTVILDEDFDDVLCYIAVPVGMNIYDGLGNQDLWNLYQENITIKGHQYNIYSSTLGGEFNEIIYNSNNIPIEPTGETEPIEPTGETEPIEPTGTTEPIELTGTTEPIEPTGETEPIEPTGTTEPIEPTGETDVDLLINNTILQLPYTQSTIGIVPNSSGTNNNGFYLKGYTNNTNEDNNFGFIWDKHVMNGKVWIIVPENFFDIENNAFLDNNSHKYKICDSLSKEPIEPVKIKRTTYNDVSYILFCYSENGATGKVYFKKIS